MRSLIYFQESLNLTSLNHPIVIALLVSSSVFANSFDHEKYIKCYDAPQQTGEWELSYKFKVNNGIKLVYPENIELGQEVTDTEGPYDWICLRGDNFQACETEGQNIRGFVPVEINEEETVYCERSILDWLGGVPF